MLAPTDCVKDRLAAFFHWNDKQGLEQALLVAIASPIDINDVIRWANIEGHNQKLQLFLDELQRIKPNLE